MNRLIKAITKIETWGAYLAALNLFLMFLLGLAELTSRTLFSYSIPVSLEYSGYMVAFSFLMGAGWTLSQGKHIRLTLLKDTGGGLSLAAGVLSLVIALLLTMGLVAWAWGSFERGSVSFFPSATPLWVPQAIFTLGPAILSLSLLKNLLLIRERLR